MISSVYKDLFITYFWQLSVIFVHAAAFYLHLITHLLEVLRPLILVDSPSFSIWLGPNGFYFSAIMLFGFPSSVTVINITVSSPSSWLKNPWWGQFWLFSPLLEDNCQILLAFPPLQAYSFLFNQIFGFFFCIFFPPSWVFPTLFFSLFSPPFKMLAAKTVNHLPFLT